MSMNSKDYLEVAVRAATIAKTVLELMNPSTPRLARFTLNDVRKQVNELDNRLIEMGGGDVPNKPGERPETRPER